VATDAYNEFSSEAPLEQLFYLLTRVSSKKKIEAGLKNKVINF
jgi:hypothetical protein